jgi:glycosyltransferase involved in cell wall biosynthesis
MQVSSNNQNLVSIIIPAYNAGKFISETIDSILSQSHTNWELFVVDDGSKDNTADIVKTYATKDNRISLISKENAGVSEARNTGLQKAKGDFITFLDADDFWMKENLQKKIDYLINHPDVDFVFSNSMHADENLNNQKPSPEGKDENILEDLLLWNGEVIPGPCSNIVARKKCFTNGVLFDKRLSTIADQDFTVQLASKYKGKLIKEILWVYRVLPGSMSKSIKLMEEDSLAAYAIYKENNYFRSASFRRKCFSNMYLIVGASWWKDGNNKGRGLRFLALALFTAPLNTTLKIIKKLFKN